ncbi:MAG: hypothetical protein ABS87_01495 [Sphingomonas sp. SCN 67-18]|nr:hypothetical protein [Sphingomonas sp. SCN 67-18]ODU22680.1 MAG: hypothetical protein ABS87_01495 [Sphingomonas sp. SCN 67-18]
MAKEIWPLVTTAIVPLPTWWLLAKNFAVTNSAALIVAAVATFFVFHITQILMAAIIIWKTPKWWEGRQRFKIWEGASALCEIMPSQYETSDRAKGFAYDILGGVQNGRIRQADESYTVHNIALAGDPIPSKYPKKPDANIDTLIGKNTLEAFANNRSMKLPWAADPKAQD